MNSVLHEDTVKSNCASFTVDDFNQGNVKEVNFTPLSVFHLNIRSLSKHFDDLFSLFNVFSSNFPIIALSETWLCNTSDCSMFELPSYYLQ